MSLSRNLLLVWLIQFVVLVASTAYISSSEETTIGAAAERLSATDVDAEHRVLTNLQQPKQEEEQLQRDLKGNVYVGAPGVYIDLRPKKPAPKATSAPAPAPTPAINTTEAIIQDDDNTDDFLPKLPAGQHAQILAANTDDELTDDFVSVPAPTLKTVEGLLVGYQDDLGKMHLFPGMEVPRHAPPKAAPIEEEIMETTIELNVFKRLLIAAAGIAIVIGCCSCQSRRKRAKATNAAYQAANQSYSDNESTLELGSMGRYRDSDVDDSADKIKGKVRRAV